MGRVYEDREVLSRIAMIHATAYRDEAITGFIDAASWT
jgi:hypothetical protein